jgi:hypothetical protein
VDLASLVSIVLFDLYFSLFIYIFFFFLANFTLFHSFDQQIWLLLVVIGSSKFKQLHMKVNFESETNRKRNYGK